MNKKIQQYQYFFADQVKEAELEQRTIIKAPMAQLFNKEELLIGYVDHLNTERGHVVLKFLKDKVPRLKVQKSVTIIKKGAKAALGSKITEWKCPFKDFCENLDFHTVSSDILPLYYLSRKDSSYDYVGCTAVSVAMFDLMQKALASGKSLTVILYTLFPPVDYYNNLINFMDLYPDKDELLIEPKIDYEDWQPEELAYCHENETAIPDTIMQSLENEDYCVLQGPPGTGKSYTIAYVIADYLNRGLTACVTTMANKGLIELVQQPPLKPFLEAGKISKTNLSADERRIVKGLKPAAKELIVSSGELLCSTNYILSGVFNSRNIESHGLPNYDLIIIEEASQAFLSTIVAFKTIGNKCLIVGDPMQLPPIISNPRKAIYKTWNANTQIEGLKTYALGTDVKSYRITTTFRLTPASALLTGIFYSNRFTSVKRDFLNFDDVFSSLFPAEGGVLYHCTDDYTNGIISDTALCIIGEIVKTIEMNYPNRELAIVSPFNDTVKLLQRSFMTDSILTEMTIETIDRIQGMTVDYAILYIPGRNPGFALDERRFNVATSRSRSTTLIISDIPLDNLHTVQGKVRKFLNGCKTV